MIEKSGISPNLPLFSKRNIDKNPSTLSVGGFFESDAPTRICSELPPSLKSGENTKKQRYLFKNLIENQEIVKGFWCYPFYKI
jgi:hypothetical protein